jgi:cytidine deaminase
MVIYTPTKSLTGPCGACRQVMAEFAPNLKVTLVNRSGRTRTYRLSELLPERFAL